MIYLDESTGAAHACGFVYCFVGEEEDFSCDWVIDLAQLSVPPLELLLLLEDSGDYHLLVGFALLVWGVDEGDLAEEGVLLDVWGLFGGGWVAHFRFVIKQNSKEKLDKVVMRKL